ncbi:hypothetical protein [Natronoglycomyces albus]|uniref:DUF4382 domain-containing protein n=1 Tax=Natronoglycomyces albus TaxID=2811108 RepID=A0A895XMQ5_9ACTN|nr:hypothetical protein [Natronoglycomyces albus]QSB04305.1 hypothetical protein JQS30_10890 [Natronoglycomyces albus]
MPRITPRYSPNPITRSPHGRRSLAAASLAVTAAFLLASCADSTDISIQTNPGWSIEEASVSVSICPQDSSDRLESAVLRGAHFGLEVECVASLSEIPDDYQIRYLTGDIDFYPLPPGYEFTLVQMAPDTSTSPSHTSDDSKLETVLIVDDHEWRFDGAPEPGAAYMVAAKADPEITLHVTDAGVQQTMDLNSGERTESVTALYEGDLTSILTDSFEGEVSGSNSRWNASYGYYIQFDASRDVWDSEAEEWVSDLDKALLTVTYLWPDTSGGDVSWDLDPESALTVSADGDSLSPTRVDREDTSFDWGDAEWIDAYFEVDGTALEFEIAFEIDGTLTVNEDNSTMRISEGKETVTFDLDFS